VIKVPPWRSAPPSKATGTGCEPRSLVLAHWVEQNVLRSDLAGSECLCVAQRKLEHPRLSASTESDLRDLHADTDGDDPHDLRTDALRRDVKRLQHQCGNGLLLNKQTEQDVFGADLIVPERPGLFPSQSGSAAPLRCESLQQSRRIAPPGGARNATDLCTTCLSTPLTAFRNSRVSGLASGGVAWGPSVPRCSRRSTWRDSRSTVPCWRAQAPRPFRVG
jgi:hypothetical protein